ncbi:hypothetical protein ACEOWF_003310 [Escherichia coli]
MKKTLIALAVAASAVVSGSAMAWTANGTGNSVELGGTLTPVEKVTPWEVKTGAAVTNLDAQVQKGQTSVTVRVKQAIPVLGIRTQTADVFTGTNEISPQINYGGAINVNGFSAGVTTLTLNVTDASGKKMGTMSVPFLAGAGVSRTGKNNDAFSAYVYDGYGVTSFKGGLGASEEQVLPNLATVISRVGALDSEFTANFNQQGLVSGDVWRATPFEDTETQYSGFYGSGIESGSGIAIALDTAVSGDGEIAWKASLPVTVSYM